MSGVCHEMLRSIIQASDPTAYVDHKTFFDTLSGIFADTEVWDLEDMCFKMAETEAHIFDYNTEHEAYIVVHKPSATVLKWYKEPEREAAMWYMNNAEQLDHFFSCLHQDLTSVFRWGGDVITCTLCLGAGILKDYDDEPKAAKCIRCGGRGLISAWI